MSYNNQLPIVLQYFTNIAAIQNVAVLQQIWLSEIIGGMLLQAARIARICDTGLFNIHYKIYH